MQQLNSQVAIKKIPVLRFLLALIGGVLIQYYYVPSIIPFICAASFSIIVITGWNYVAPIHFFANSVMVGVLLHLLFIGIGGMLCNMKSGKTDADWIGNHYKTGAPIKMTIEEPLVSKTKTYKAVTTASSILIGNEWKPISGKAILYFRKDSLPPRLDYGSQIIVLGNLEKIKGTGNPGSFDYSEYAAFQQIYYQGFIKRNEYLVLNYNKGSALNKWMFEARNWVLNTLKNNIKDKEELGVAEALLIGYRDDLDRGLVQAYSNTGVVHIIAISGLHLGMIYSLLELIFGLFKKKHWVLIAKPITIIAVLWGFSFMAGAAPSILRSAVMFTFVVLGECFGRRTSTYNNLALSALVIILINPFSLWDVGFQLSYGAVISIMLFSKPIAQLIPIKNKILWGIWNLCAVSISAQILTLPLILYHFHQVPTLFLITNIVAVPLSGIILYVELVLLILSFISPFALFIGRIISFLLWIMNEFIRIVNNIPLSVISGIEISLIQTLLLYLVLISLIVWIVDSRKKWFINSLMLLFVFFEFGSYDIMKKQHQHKLVVYNISKHTAIDVIDGTNCTFIGDSVVNKDQSLYNFHIKPCRTLYRTQVADSLPSIAVYDNFIQFNNKKVTVLDKPLPHNLQPTQKIKVDVVVITKNPKIYVNQLLKYFDCNQLVFDATNPFWKVNYWKQDAQKLHIPYYDIREQGAFVMDLD